MTGRPANKDETIPHCPCCGGQAWQTVPYLENIHYLRCGTCDYHLQVREGGGDREAMFRAEQDKFYNEESVVVSPAFAALNEEITRRRLKTIEAFLVPGAKLIEAGPGSGEVIIALTDKGFETAAAEHSKTLADRLTQLRGIPVFNGDFVDQPLQSEVFDAYCSFHVIEHVVDFKKHLEAARAMVKPGGLAFIATPNAAGWEQRLPFRLSPNNDSSHFQLFSNDSLTRVLDAEGWKVIHVTTPSYAIAWLRVLTKILRRMKGQDENATGGHYARTVNDRAGKVIRLFAAMTAPFRKLQEAALAGNEVFLVARKV